MKAEHIFISYNSNKSIEELRYNLSNHVTILEDLKLDLDFYLALFERPIFEPQIMNLYENLVLLKKEITHINEKRMILLNKLQTETNKISNKIECDDLACDNYFISEYDALEQEIFNYRNVVSNFKFRLFQYMQSVFLTS